MPLAAGPVGGLRPCVLKGELNDGLALCPCPPPNPLFVVAFFPSPAMVLVVGAPKGEGDRNVGALGVGPFGGCEAGNALPKVGCAGELPNGFCVGIDGLLLEAVCGVRKGFELGDGAPKGLLEGPVVGLRGAPKTGPSSARPPGAPKGLFTFEEGAVEFAPKGAPKELNGPAMVALVEIQHWSGRREVGDGTRPLERLRQGV
jgi:hypothetical protein